MREKIVISGPYSDRPETLPVQARATKLTQVGHTITAYKTRQDSRKYSK